MRKHDVGHDNNIFDDDGIWMRLVVSAFLGWIRRRASFIRPTCVGDRRVGDRREYDKGGDRNIALEIVQLVTIA